MKKKGMIWETFWNMLHQNTWSNDQRKNTFIFSLPPFKYFGTVFWRPLWWHSLCFFFEGGVQKSIREKAGKKICLLLFLPNQEPLHPHLWLQFSVYHCADFQELLKEEKHLRPVWLSGWEYTSEPEGHGSIAGQGHVRIAGSIPNKGHAWGS